MNKRNFIKSVIGLAVAGPALEVAQEQSWLKQDVIDGIYKAARDPAYDSADFTFISMGGPTPGGLEMFWESDLGVSEVRT